MKKLLTLFLLLSATLRAESYTYGDFHAMGGWPMLGVGTRFHKQWHALDLSGHVMPFAPCVFHIQGLYLVYPCERGFYMGAGLGVMGAPETLRYPSGSFEWAMGYEWHTKVGRPLFVALGTSIPFREPRGVGRICPHLTFGIAF